MTESELVGMLKAVAEPSRLRILKLLANEPGGMSAGAIAAGFELKQNTLSSHLSALAEAGLIVGMREGRSIIYAIDAAQVRGLVNQLSGALAGKD